MSKDYDGPRIQLSNPLTYRGQQHHVVYLEGRPFRGVPSLYEELSESVNNGQMLDVFAIKDLGAEATAYSIRFDVQRNNNNTIGAIESMDKARAISHFVSSQTDSDEVRESAETHLTMSQIALCSVLADYAVGKHNYLWAEALLEESIDRYPRYINFGLFDPSIGERVNVMAAMLDPSFGVSPRLLSDKLNAVRKRSKTDAEHRDILPIAEPYSDSFEAVLTRHHNAKEYEQAKRVHDGLMDRVETPLLFSRGDRYTKWIARYLLTNSLPMDIVFSLTGDRLEIYRRGTDVLSPYEKFVTAGGKRITRYFGAYKEWLIPRLMGMIHSDDFVFQFGRFPDEIGFYGKQ